MSYDLFLMVDATLLVIVGGDLGRTSIPGWRCISFMQTGKQAQENRLGVGQGRIRDGGARMDASSSIKQMRVMIHVPSEHYESHCV